MLKGSIGAVVIVAAAVVAAWGEPPHPGPAPGAGAGQRGAAAAPAAAARQFPFRRLVFTIPASWEVQRADRQPFRMEFVTVTGRPSGPRLTFSDTVELIVRARSSQRRVLGSGRPLSFQRLEMPNAMGRGIVYVFPEAGVTMSAQVRTAADVRAADAVAASARWALPGPGTARS